MKSVMSLDFYDMQHKPIAYTDDDEHLYAYCGRPLAYFHEGSVYSYPGLHLGFIANGYIRDNNGHIVLRTPESGGGSMKMWLLPPPPKGPKQMRYLKCRRRPKFYALMRLFQSKIPGDEFFS
ncbi:hypothetical protein PS870_03978 [Pseudomonas fluorescens]|uniref:4-fold beta flower domain-containing protein n=2 Tax=Pseudomonas TaxID=286 RepID=A0A5E7MHE0_PSEFL|nr:hypothetical protein PS870_03978 [Pseudomonas fluorescens]